MTIAELRVADSFFGTRCDFASLSHFAYHAKNDLQGRQRRDAETDRLIQSLLVGLTPTLGPNGLVLAFHEGPASDMFGKRRREYGVAMPDAQCGSLQRLAGRPRSW